jgi:hypothetical protein
MDVSPQILVRQCLACGETFTITHGEMQFFTERARESERAWVLPARCLPCRQARRRANQVIVPDDGDVVLRCCDCGASFDFRSRDRVYFASQGYCYPRRCSNCRPRR